jgi:coenzyme Q-binding protein COQ10
MAARLGLRQAPLALALPKPHLHQTRPFSLPSLSDLSNISSSTPRTLTASRNLPYPPALLYSIISDIPSYSSFLPFCTSSVVHTYTPTAPRLPVLATLTVGWGPFPAESYTSRVYCVPGETVEAVSGNAGPSTTWDVLRRHGYEERAAKGGAVAGDKRDGDGELFESLVTKWTVRPVEGGTDVDLRIDYLMANPLHQIAVGGVADQVADKMIRAFEARAERLHADRQRKEMR